MTVPGVPGGGTKRLEPIAPGLVKHYHLTVVGIRPRNNWPEGRLLTQLEKEGLTP